MKSTPHCGALALDKNIQVAHILEQLLKKCSKKWSNFTKSGLKSGVQ